MDEVNALPPSARAGAGNRLLAALPADEMARLAPRLERVALAYRLELYEVDGPAGHAWFPHRGVVSLLATAAADAPPVEIATIGPEGLVGVQLALGEATMGAHMAFAQVPGEADRIAAADFAAALSRCPTLSRLVMRYTLALINQMAQNAACNRTHEIEQRLARWLLMTQDRVHSSTFPLTQEFIGQMLGVRRPTVSIAASLLMRAGLIRYVRGQITVTDRPGLEAAACDCYRVIAGQFERLVHSRG